MINRLIKIIPSTMLLLLALAASAASADSLVVAPIDSATRNVKSLEFVTLGFTATLNGGTGRDFTISSVIGNGAILVGAPSSVFLSPGSPESFAVTVMVSPNVGGSQLIAVSATVTDSSAQALSANANVNLVADNLVCAEFVNPPTDMLFENANISNISIKIRNCGDSTERFELSAHPGDGVTAHGRTKSFNIASGEIVEHVFNATISGDGARGLSLKLRLSKDGTPVAETTLFANVIREKHHVKNTRHKSLDIRLAVGHYIRSGNRGVTSIQLAIPGFEDGDFYMKTDVGMQRSDTENLRVKRQTHEFRYGNTKLTLGNQRVDFSKRTRGRAFHDGWTASRAFGANEISFGSGGGSGGDVSFVKWNRTVAGGVSLGVGRLWNKTPSLGVSRMTADSVNLDYAASEKISVKTELARTKIETPEGASASGSVVGVESEYRNKNLSVRAFGQTGDKYFQANGPTREAGLRAEFRTGSGGRVSADYKKGTTFRALTPDSPEASRPGYGHETFSAGYSRSTRSGIQARVSVNGRRRDIAAADNALLSAPLFEDFIRVGLSKNIKPFNFGIGLDSGRRRFLDAKGGYNKFALNAGYRNKSTRVSAEINSTSGRGRGLPAFSSEQTYSFSAAYLLPDKKNSIQASWRNGTVDNSFDYSPIKSTRFSISLNSKLSSNTSIDLAFHASNSRGVAENVFFLKYAKDFELKIPYKKYGAIYGIVFEDANGNGVFDGADKALAGVKVVCGPTYKAVTDINGEYEISAVSPGHCEMRVEPESHSVRLSPSPTNVGTIKASYNKRVRADMAMLPVYSVSGHVSVKADNYFARASGVSPEKLRVSLSSGGKNIAHTFTDASGYYYFENVLPETYRIAIDPDWLPAIAEIVGPSEHTVRCDGGTICSQLDFTIGIKQKEISFKEFKIAPAFMPLRFLLLSVSDFGVNAQCYLWNGAPNIPPPMIMNICETQ